MAYQSEIEKLEQRFGEKPEQWFAALADAYRKAGELDMALDLLNTWIGKRPNYTSGHIVLGRCLLDKESLDEAIKAFEGVLGLDPENIIAIRALAEIAQKRGDAGGAEHWLERLLDVDPMNEEANEALAALRGAGTEPEAAPAQAPSTAEEPVLAGPADPMAIAGQMKLESEQVEQVDEPAPDKAAPEQPAEPVPEAVLEEVTLEMAPADSSIPIEPIIEPIPEPAPEVAAEAPSEFDIDVAFGQPELSDEAQDTPDETPESAAEAVSAEAGPTPAAADDQGTQEGDAHHALDGLEVSSFDDELAWDAGDRTSHQISSEDIQEALQAHENGLDEPAHLLPGIEDAEVPHVGVEERETPQVDGFEPPPEESDTEAGTVEGLEPTVAAAADQEPPAEVDAPPEMPAEPEPVEETAPAPAAAVEETAPAPAEPVEEAAPAPAAAAAEEELPLIIPEEEPAAEALPVVTETMAELFAQQGLFVEAFGIYEQVLAGRPGDAGLQSKLDEMKKKAAAAKVPVAPPQEPRFSAAQTGGVSVRTMFAEILGTEPAPPIAAPAPAEEPAVPGFDEFFGGEKAAPVEGPEPTTRRHDDEDTDDEFRGWLKSLNT